MNDYECESEDSKVSATGKKGPCTTKQSSTSQIPLASRVASLWPLVQSGSKASPKTFRSTTGNVPGNTGSVSRLIRTIRVVGKPRVWQLDELKQNQSLKLLVCLFVKSDIDLSNLICSSHYLAGFEWF